MWKKKKKEINAFFFCLFLSIFVLSEFTPKYAHQKTGAPVITRNRELARIQSSKGTGQEWWCESKGTSTCISGNSTLLPVLNV